jgi:hypothetical protein
MEKSLFILASLCDLLAFTDWVNVFSIRRSITSYYKMASLIIHYLGAFTVGEATASVRRTKLAVVRHKCTNSRVTRKRDSDQTRPADT